MESFWLIFSILLRFSISSAKLRYEEDINEFLFPKERNVVFVDLTHIHDIFSETPGSTLGEICVNARLNEARQWIYQQPKEKSIGNIPLNHLILPLIIVDISDKVNGDPNFVLQKYHLDYLLNNYFGHTYQPCLIIFKFGWTKYQEDKKFAIRDYYVVDQVNKTTFANHPEISEDLAKWITRSYKNVVGVGVDTPSMDSRLSKKEEQTAFRVFTDAGVYVLENVKLEQYLPEALCTAVVSPLKTLGNCSPYRLMAICPQSKMTPRQTLLHHL